MPAPLYTMNGRGPSSQANRRRVGQSFRPDDEFITSDMEEQAPNLGKWPVSRQSRSVYGAPDTRGYGPTTGPVSLQGERRPDLETPRRIADLNLEEIPSTDLPANLGRTLKQYPPTEGESGNWL